MEYIASAASGLLSKHRKAVLSAMVVLMLVSYQLQGLRHDGYPIPIGYTYGSPGGHGTNVTDADYGLGTGQCMVGRAFMWGGSNVRPIIMLSQTAMLTQAQRSSAKLLGGQPSNENAGPGGSMLPVFGAADLIAQAGGDTFTYKQQPLPLPISNHVRNSSSWIVALDPMVGVLKTITHLSTDTAGCVTIEDSWFAHAAYSGLIVRDIQLTNSLPTPAAVHLESVVMPESFVPVTNITTEKRMKVWSSPLSETRSVVLVHSAIFSNLTLQPQVSRKRRLLLYAQIVPTEDVLDRAQEVVDRFAVFSLSTTLLKEHEVTWSAMWPQKLIISGPPIESTMTMRAAFYTTVYYFLAGRHSMADIPLKAEDESHAGCYVGPLLRAAEQWPVLPDLVLTLPTYLRAWVQKLAHGGCSLSSPSDTGTVDPSRFIQSLVYGFFGIHVGPDEETVFISPSRDIPVATSVEVDAVTFNHHRIQVDLSYRQLNVSRRDLLSEPIFTSAHQDDIIELQHYSTRRVRPLNGVLVANDKHEVDQHWAHDTQHHHTDVNIGEEAEVQTPSPWGRWLLILLIAAVVGFHGLLMYLVYNEYLAPGAGSESRQTWLNRWKRKHSTLPTRASPGRSFKESSATGRRQDVNSS